MAQAGHLGLPGPFGAAASPAVEGHRRGASRGLRPATEHQLRPRLDRLAGDNAAAVTIVKQGAEARASGFLDVIEAHFAANGPFFLGAQISAADRYLTMLARWARPMTNPPRSRPHIARLLDAVIARPAVKRAYATEGISEQIC